MQVKLIPERISFNRLERLAHLLSPMYNVANKFILLALAFQGTTSCLSRAKTTSASDLCGSYTTLTCSSTAVDRSLSNLGRVVCQNELQANQLV